MREEKSPAVYLLASRKYGVLYIGVTSALWNRVATHKDGGIEGFTKKYNVKLLVWHEHHHSMTAAIKREKQLKKWNRVWKLRLIEEFNPNWNDLHEFIDYDHTLVSENTDARLRGHDGF
jgi:putative endonuclease